jgi:4-diphosphocytidyl-2-C-methyl-D-erythritol kinase
VASSSIDLNLRLRAFAKINLGLRILGRRPDGYHEIRTIYQTISLHDRLEISLVRAGQGIAVECSDPSVPRGPENLVYRACDLWRRARKFRGRVEVRLEKRIPAGSGLGGASSDAAVALLGLEALTGDRLPWPARWELAAQLGSDVPLFFWGGRVLGCGRGEEVYPLGDLLPRSCLVAFPGFPVSTAEAYRASSARLTSQGTSSRMDVFGAWPRPPREEWGPAENDFERVVFAQWPELARVKRRLIRAGAETASLTGSGSAVYALFNSARQLSQAWEQVPTGWQKFRTRTLSRARYRREILQGR